MPRYGFFAVVPFVALALFFATLFLRFVHPLATLVTGLYPVLVLAVLVALSARGSFHDLLSTFIASSSVGVYVFVLACIDLTIEGIVALYRQSISPDDS